MSTITTNTKEVSFLVAPTLLCMKLVEQLDQRDPMPADVKTYVGNVSEAIKRIDEAVGKLTPPDIADKVMNKELFDELAALHLEVDSTDVLLLCGFMLETADAFDQLKELVVKSMKQAIPLLRASMLAEGKTPPPEFDRFEIEAREDLEAVSKIMGDEKLTFRSAMKPFPALKASDHRYDPRSNGGYI